MTAGRNVGGDVEIVFEKVARAVDITLRALHFGLRRHRVLTGLLHLHHRSRLERQQRLRAIVVPLREFSSCFRLVKIRHGTSILRAQVMHLIGVIAGEHLPFLYVVAEADIYRGHETVRSHTDMPVAIVGERNTARQTQDVRRFAERDRLGPDSRGRLFRGREHNFTFVGGRIRCGALR